MTKILVLVIFILSSSLYAKAALVNPDILVYTRTETRSNIFLLKEFRTFMNNLSMGIDPYSYEHGKAMIFEEDSIQEFIADDAARLIDSISIASGINILDVKPELVLEGFKYKIRSINPQIIPTEKKNGDVILHSNIGIEGIEASATAIKLRFLLNQEIRGKQIPALEVKIVNAKVVFNKTINFGLDVLLKEKKDAIQLGFENGDFSLINEMLNEYPDLISIEYDDIEIPEISVEFMGRTLTINEEKIKEIIAVHKPSLQAILLEQVKVLFEKDGAMELLKHFDGTSFDRNYWIDTTSEYMFPMFLGIKDFSSPMPGVLLTELEGDFCTTVNFRANGGDCVDHRITKMRKTTVSKADYAYSKQSIETLMTSDKDVKFIASIGEDYINKAIVTTIDFGIWEPIMKEIEVEMGDAGVVIKFDKLGKNATVYLDVIYDSGSFTGFLLGKRKLRFPVVLDATVRAQYYDVETKNENGEVVTESKPHIVFTVNDVNLDDKVLLYGVPELGFPSNIQNVRKMLRKTVLKKLKKELFDYDAPTDPERFAKWKGVDIPPLLLPEISDMHIEKMDISSDGHGRLNLILKGSETIYRN